MVGLAAPRRHSKVLLGKKNQRRREVSNWVHRQFKAEAGWWWILLVCFFVLTGVRFTWLSLGVNDDLSADGF
jgi:hypothetical protein